MGDTKSVHFNVHTTQFDSSPEFGGTKAILYRSEDGTRQAGSFHESGRHSMVTPFDEFIYVVGGGCTVSVKDGETFRMSVGDCCYLRKGAEVEFDMDDDFHDVAVLIADERFDFDSLGQ